MLCNRSFTLHAQISPFKLGLVVVFLFHTRLDECILKFEALVEALRDGFGVGGVIGGVLLGVGVGEDAGYSASAGVVGYNFERFGKLLFAKVADVEVGLRDGRGYLIGLVGTLVSYSS